MVLVSSTAYFKRIQQDLVEEVPSALQVRTLSWWKTVSLTTTIQQVKVAVVAQLGKRYVSALICIFWLHFPLILSLPLFNNCSPCAYVLPKTLIQGRSIAREPPQNEWYIPISTFGTIVRNSTFTGNNVHDGGGGAIHSIHSDVWLLLESCSFHMNSADDAGG